MNNSHIRPLVGLLVVIALVAVLSLLRTAAGNIYHESEASGILTMAECLKCHDGTTGKMITVCLGNDCLYLRNHSMMHPYPPAAKVNDYASRTEIEQAGCVLEDGKITCLSCHDLTKPAPHLIRSGDQLCLICHKNLRGKGGLIAEPRRINSASAATFRWRGSEGPHPTGVLQASLQLLELVSERILRVFQRNPVSEGH
ncbi:MAG TPA: hypothetical protein VJ550_04235 [Geomonas sp.]|nr:hypothetical protein [Geomonas sp.]